MPVHLTVPPTVQAAIEKTIHSAESPVGIDAKQTHVIIIHKLLQLEERLTRLEETLAKLSRRA